METDCAVKTAQWTLPSEAHSCRTGGGEARRERGARARIAVPPGEAEKVVEGGGGGEKEEWKPAARHLLVKVGIPACVALTSVSNIR